MTSPRWPSAADVWQRIATDGFPFMPLPGSQPMRRLRHLARRALFAGHPAWRRWLLQIAMAVAWPVGAVLELRRHLLRTPDADRPTHPWGWVQRGGHMLALAWIDNVPPRNYVAYRLHDPARRERIDVSFYGSEILTLCAQLNRRNGAAGDDVQDKARFADLCRAHGLPCVPTLAVFREGVQAMPFLPDGSDLWVKALAGDRGAGAARWRREGDVYRHAWDGRLCRPAELVAAWRAQNCIIQPCLENHPALAPLSAGPLIDFRIVTGIDRQGRVTVIAALAQFPCSGQPARFIFAPVGPASDIRSPRLRGHQPVTHHPDTGQQLAGAIVPFWPEALDLVVRAHGGVPEFSRFVFLGWDVAIAEAGPLLIETNAGWGGVNHQLGDGIPLGLTALPAIALDHLNNGRRCG